MKIKISITILLLVTSFSFAQPKPIPYQIIHTETDNRGLVNTLDIYITHVSDIKALNKMLFDRYKKTGIVTFQIYYYDNITVARQYRRATFDRNISDKSLDKMAQHIVGIFNYNPYVKPSEELKVGRDPENR